MPSPLIQFLRLLAGALRDLAPIILVIAVFQIFVLRQPLPDLASVATGLVLVVLGLALFVQGLEMGLFPLGETLAHQFAAKGSLPVLLTFAFLLGFTATIAEPALTAVAGEAATAAVEAGMIAAGSATGDDAHAAFAIGLRLTVAAGVGCALVIGVLRTLLGWSVAWFMLGGYALILAVTPFAPPYIVGIAYDSGGVTTSTITVPLVAALGVGLATSIKGRNPMLDGFGMVAFASLMPMLFVMLFGLFA